jgi:Flp pilus assembly protein TadD
MSFSRKDQHHLQASVGYTQLGMNTEALEELDHVSTLARHSVEVLSLELAILHQNNQWKQAAHVAGKILSLDPSNPDWHIAAAYATRRALSLEEANIILTQAVDLFPANALIHYNLGCYAAQLGELEKSYVLVRRAFDLDPHFEKVAKTDPDLNPIRSRLKSSRRAKKRAIKIPS